MFLMKNRQMHKCGFHFVAKYTHCGFQREAVEKIFFRIIFCSSAACFMQLFILAKFRQKEK
jgi:hypothetical protein